MTPTESALDDIAASLIYVAMALFLLVVMLGLIHSELIEATYQLRLLRVMVRRATPLIPDDAATPPPPVPSAPPAASAAKDVTSESHPLRS